MRDKNFKTFIIPFIFFTTIIKNKTHNEIIKAYFGNKYDTIMDKHVQAFSSYSISHYQGHIKDKLHKTFRQNKTLESELTFKTAHHKFKAIVRSKTCENFTF